MALYIEAIEETMSFDDDPVRSLIANKRNDETLNMIDELVHSLIVNEENAEAIALVDEPVGTLLTYPELDESLLLDPEEDDDLVWWAELNEPLMFPVSFPANYEFEEFVELTVRVEEDLELDAEHEPNKVINEESAEALNMIDEVDGVRTVDFEEAETLALVDDPDAFALILGHRLEGRHRIENEDLDRYEVFVGVDELPDLPDDPVNEPPDAVFTGTSGTVPLTLDAENYVVVRKRDKSGLVDLGNDAKVYRIDASGNLVAPRATPPSFVSLRGAADGNILIEAEYNPAPDDPPANQWQIYLTDDGSDPVLEPPEAPWDLYAGGAMDPIGEDPQPIKHLSFTTVGPVPPGGGGWPTGTVLKVVVGTFPTGHIGWRGIGHSEIYTWTIDAEGFDVEDADISIGGNVE